MPSSNKKSFSETCEYYFQRFSNSERRLQAPFDARTEIIVVIPSMNEPALTKTLTSLSQCDEPGCKVGVIVVVNASKMASEPIKSQNKTSIVEIIEFNAENKLSWLTIDHLDANNLSERDAGVGYARKIGMDEALREFARIDINGVIVCLDADCTVRPDYFSGISSHYSDNNAKSAHTYFEHDWSRESDPIIKNGIINYELSLRYFVEGLKYAGFPHAYHTVGSCMSVRAETYALAGGMNKRKAGEDFYFINKLIPIRGFGSINTTCVYPSCRTSDRVPFGTGKALTDWKAFKHAEQNGIFLCYSFETFEDIKRTMPLLSKLYKCKDDDQINTVIAEFPQSTADFFRENGLLEKVNELNGETSSADQFLQRLLLWWSGLKMIKYVHYARDNHYPLTDLGNEAVVLLSELDQPRIKKDDSLSLLNAYRELELSSN